MQKLKAAGYAENNLDPTGFYRNLRKMEKEGYLTATMEGTGSKAKKFFAITDFGKRALLNWEESLRSYRKHIDHIISGIQKNC